MSRFENKLCPVCRTRFNESADTVVCPVCGTPHHRSCYSIKGKCAMEELHDSGWAWEGKLPDEEPEKLAEEPMSDLEAAAIDTDLSSRRAEYPEGTPTSRFDDDDDDDDDVFDNVDVDNPIRRMFENFHNKDIGEDGVSMQELVSYSATNLYHYGRAFYAFRTGVGGKKRFMFFNFCSGLFAPVFQFYRKMNFFGAAALLLMMMPSVIMTMAPEGSIVRDGPAAYLLQIVPPLLSVLLCMFGDYIYYRHCVSHIVRFRKSYDGDTKSDEYYNALQECGKPTFAGGLIGCLALSFAQACILALPKWI